MDSNGDILERFIMVVDTIISGYGVDQLQNVIDLIKNDPTSRRIILNSWNATI